MRNLKRELLAVMTTLVAAPIVLAGCASNSDVDARSEPRPLVERRVHDVPVAAAQALALYDRMAAGMSLDEADRASWSRIPIHGFDGASVRYYLTFSSSRDVGDDPVAFVMSVSDAEVDAPGFTTSIIGATTDVAPLGLRANHGRLLALLRKTIAAMGGRRSFDQLREVAGNGFVVTSKNGALYVLGHETPLTDAELVEYRALADKQAEDWKARQSEIAPELRAKWAMYLGEDEFKVGDATPAAFTAADGTLDFQRAVAELRGSGAEEGLASAFRTPAEIDSERAKTVSSISPKAVVNEASTCSAHFLWWCVAWNKIERGAYDSSCIGENAAHRCQGNLTSRAVAHTEGSHPMSLGGTHLSYSGCAPESFATMVWRRYVNGDDDFGFDRARTLAPSTYQSSDNDGPGTVMFESANAGALAMSTRAIGNQGFTWPWNYMGANEWLRQRGSKLQLRSNLSYFIGNALPWVANEKAEILHRLVGKEQGPVVAGGFVGPEFYLYHYAPVFAYRITRVSVAGLVDVVTDISVKVDYGPLGGTYEMPLANAGVAFAGLYYFGDDYDRTTGR